MTIASRRALRGSMAALATVFAFAGTSFAGECPADKMRADATPKADHMAKAVTDQVLAQIDLGAEKVALKGHNMRVRKLVIQPGGIVPWHDHAARPANIYVVSGSITEYRSNCAVPIVHKAGDTVAEYGAGLAHWWKNTGDQPVVLISADLFQSGKMDDHVM